MNNNTHVVDTATLLEKANAKKPFNLKRFIIRTIESIFVVLGILIILFPIFWIVVRSFAPNDFIPLDEWTFFPQNPTLDNFKAVLFEPLKGGYNLPRALFWTLIVSVVSVVLGLVIMMTAAFAFARLEFRGKGVLWWYTIITMFIPGIAVNLTSVFLVDLIGLKDTLWVLILPGLAGGYGIFFFRQFFLGLPSSLEEAAMIDGCPVFQIFLKIFVPMSITPIVIIATRMFNGHWNSYLWPALTIRDRREDFAQVMQLLAALKDGKEDTAYIIAATMVSIIIPIILFALNQKRIVSGIAISGMK
ncbi:MAG: carbohydrate ABC transporter permease [Clostridiales bacterium]|nr:carbohydrate ABC transporter permease [Clostridiales bacterium]